MARRRTEIDYLNGGIAKFGAEEGIPTPLNETIAALIKGVESPGRRTPRATSTPPRGALNFLRA